MMPLHIDLNERYQQILWATIRQYIATAEPVGSKTLAEEYDLSVSSATIRNIMKRLEKVGLLYQPHTSAGRVPSDWGYRIYVDQLITPDEVAGRQIEKPFNQLKWDSWSLEALLHGAAQILAALSGYIALITMPQTASNQIKHLQLVQVASGQVMLILVTDAYQTQSVLVDFPESLAAPDSEELVDGELQILSNFLNAHLRGRTLAELSHLDGGELDRKFERYSDFLKQLIIELSRRSQLAPSVPIMVRGVSEVLRQPEFSQLEQVQTLLHLLEEEQEQLLPLIFEAPEPESASKRVRVIIGAENPLEPMRPCALVSCPYRQEDVTVGSVGVIGPTRMLYENAIALVESTADYLSEALS